MKWELDRSSLSYHLKPSYLLHKFPFSLPPAIRLRQSFITSIQERLIDEHASEVFRYYFFKSCFVASGKLFY